ncbi:response regulator [bacterium]|nr:response regulator [bacterium]
MTNLPMPRPSVILADSDPARIRFIKDCLIRFNLNPIAVSDAEQFESAVLLSNPFLFIIDNMFTHAGGVAVCADIKSRKPNLPCSVILMIPDHNPGLRIAGFKAGMNDYLLKPVSEDELNTKISAYAARIFGEWRAQKIANDASRLQSAVMLEWYSALTYCAAGAEFAEQHVALKQPERSVCEHIRMNIDAILASLYEHITQAHMESLTIQFEKEHCDVAQVLDLYHVRYNALSCIARISLEWHVPVDSLPAFANKNLIGAALDFLLLNAVGVSPAGSVVSLAVSVDFDTAFIHIKDSGGGMDARTKDRLFTPFRKIGEQGKWALGLFLTEKIISFHNGKIFVETVSGGGSTFTFSLPLFHGIK